MGDSLKTNVLTLRYCFDGMNARVFDVCLLASKVQGFFGQFLARSIVRNEYGRFLFCNFTSEDNFWATQFYRYFFVGVNNGAATCGFLGVI